MNIKPMDGKVLIERHEQESVTASGIIIPDENRERQYEATVLAVGDGLKLSNGKTRGVTVREGDRVIFGKYSGMEFDFKNYNLLIIEEDDIMAIIDAN